MVSFRRVKRPAGRQFFHFKILKYVTPFKNVVTNIAVKIEFEQKLYEELKQALAYFANVPVVDPQSHRFVLNPDNGQPLMIVHSPKVGEFLKLGAIKIVEDYKNPMVRQGCDNLKLQLKNLMKQTGGGSLPPKK